MALSINNNLNKQVAEAPKNNVLYSLDATTSIGLFIKNAQAVNQNTLLLSKLVVTILENDLPDSTLQKLRQVFAKTICVEGNRKAFLARGPSLEALKLKPEEYDGATPLTLACQVCDLETIQDAAKSGNLNEANELDQTPLMLATQYNRPEVVQFLLSLGVKDTADALHIACEKGYLKIIQALVTRDNVNVPDNLEQTPLMIACSYNHPEAVQILLQQKEVDRDLKGQRGWTALHYACVSGCYDAVVALVKPETLNMRTDLKNTPLMLACSNNHPQVVLFLIQMGAELEAVDEFCMSAMDSACSGGCLEAVQALVTEDNINSCENADESTPLMLASEENHVEIARFLLSQGAERDFINSEGMTALHAACFAGALETVQLLVTPDNINLMPEFGETPLMYACKQNHPEIMVYLLSHGAQAEIANADGQTALHNACFSGCLEAVKALVTKDNINQANKSGMTPLKIACANHHLEVASYLIEQGAHLQTNDAQLFKEVVLHLRGKLRSEFIVKKITPILHEWEVPFLYPKCINPSLRLYDLEIETGADLVKKVGIDNVLEILYKTGATQQEMLEALNKKIETARWAMPPDALLSSRELLQKSGPCQEIVAAEKRYNISALHFYLTI